MMNLFELKRHLEGTGQIPRLDEGKGYVVSADKKRTQDGRMIPARHINMDRPNKDPGSVDGSEEEENRRGKDREETERMKRQQSNQIGTQNQQGSLPPRREQRGFVAAGNDNKRGGSGLTKPMPQGNARKSQPYSFNPVGGRDDVHSELARQAQPGRRQGQFVFYNDAPLPRFKTWFTEKVTAHDDVGKWIDDFRKSDAPQFKGKSPEKRRQMAIAAALSAKREAGIKQ